MKIIVIECADKADQGVPSLSAGAAGRSLVAMGRGEPAIPHWQRGQHLETGPLRGHTAWVRAKPTAARRIPRPLGPPRPCAIPRNYLHTAPTGTPVRTTFNTTRFVPTTRWPGRCPVVFSEMLHWSIFRHAEVMRVLLDPVTFSNGVSRHVAVPNGMDPPEHTAYRRAIEPPFFRAARGRFRAHLPRDRRCAGPGVGGW